MYDFYKIETENYDILLNLIKLKIFVNNFTSRKELFWLLGLQDRWQPKGPQACTPSISQCKTIRK